MVVTFLLLVCALAAAEASAAQPVPTPKAIYFATGSTRGWIGGRVEPGKEALYSVKGEAGQRMTVTLTAPRRNVVFRIYPPDTAIARDAAGTLEFKGKALHDSAAPGEDSTRWSGELSVSGTYLILLESTGGTGRYSMDVKLE